MYIIILGLIVIVLYPIFIFFTMNGSIIFRLLTIIAGESIFIITCNIFNLSINNYIKVIPLFSFIVLALFYKIKKKCDIQ